MTHHPLDSHRNASRPHPKLLAVGVECTVAHDPDCVIDVHDWVTAEDAAHSIISHHVELANLLGAVAGGHAEFKARARVRPAARRFDGR